MVALHQLIVAQLQVFIQTLLSLVLSLYAECLLPRSRTPERTARWPSIVDFEDVVKGS